MAGITKQLIESNPTIQLQEVEANKNLPQSTVNSQLINIGRKKKWLNLRE
jgi:hypothetical protein